MVTNIKSVSILKKDLYLSFFYLILPLMLFYIARVIGKDLSHLTYSSTVAPFIGFVLLPIATIFGLIRVSLIASRHINLLWLLINSAAFGFIGVLITVISITNSEQKEDAIAFMYLPFIGMIATYFGYIINYLILVLFFRKTTRVQY